ncbi:AAA family ATPase [Luteimonas sp. RD2P54]|uniref:AAA family ATPase n=1 Tax=Luteimonas endophytica TaxID=3042023 RepID=A0ABT6J5V9_9GAMM|nr:ExeA family protein [Luteimonas endophytica]MDH5821603.1 AAA family ATPase [Luteimonas endophytica]
MNPALGACLQRLGLTRIPFPPTPDASAYFHTPLLERELAETAHCLRTRAGIVLLTGEVGLGKTTFLRRLLALLEEDGADAALVLNTFLQGEELLAAILADFGLAAGAGTAAGLELLTAFLVERRAQGRLCVLVIDDAQNLSLESLELLRLLTNLETGQEKLLQIVLSGQPELAASLAAPAIRQLTTRIVKHVRLSAMDAAQVRDYVGFRLAVAGAAGRIQLSAPGLRALLRASRGNPRRIHLILDRCLYGLVAAGGGTIDAALVRAATAESGAQLGEGRARRPRLLASAALGGFAAAAIAAAAAFQAGAPTGPANGPAGSLPAAGAVVEAAGAARAPAPAPPAVAAAAPAHGRGWNACIDALAAAGAGGVQLARVDRAWAARLDGRADTCLAREGTAWRVAWRGELSPERFFMGPDSARNVRRVQGALAAEGLYPAAIDGLYGPRLRAAIRGFQARNGLEATGLPDAATLLFIDTLATARAAAGPALQDHHGDS